MNKILTEVRDFGPFVSALDGLNLNETFPEKLFSEKVSFKSRPSETGTDKHDSPL